MLSALVKFDLVIIVITQLTSSFSFLQWHNPELFNIIYDCICNRPTKSKLGHYPPLMERAYRQAVYDKEPIPQLEIDFKEWKSAPPPS